MVQKNKKKAAKLAGNSLVFTIVISLVLSLLCLLFILVAYHNRNEQIKNNIEDKLGYNLQSATNIVLADSTLITQSIFQRFDLFEKGNDSVMINRRPWGILQMAEITAFQDRFKKGLVFLYASNLPDYMNGAIYLADHQRPLSLVGKTKIIGDIYTSKAGVKAGYIDQRGFENKNLLEGNIKISGDSLPGLRKGAREYMNSLFALSSDSVAGYTSLVDDFIERDSLIQFFGDTTLIYILRGRSVIESKKLSGNIIIVSDSALEIRNTALLENIVLVAPIIKFDSGFNGHVQAFAQDSIIAESNCIFQYPSALVLNKKPSESLQNRMIIKKDCIVNGWVISVCDNRDLYKSFVEIQDRAIINGVVYVNGYVSMKSTINGVVLADYFMYKTPAIIYENHLLDIEINRRKLSGYFLGSPVFSAGKKNAIIQWLQ
jgi:hypothetical protein